MLAPCSISLGDALLATRHQATGGEGVAVESAGVLVLFALRANLRLTCGEGSPSTILMPESITYHSVHTLTSLGTERYALHLERITRPKIKE